MLFFYEAGRLHWPAKDHMPTTTYLLLTSALLIAAGLALFAALRIRQRRAAARPNTLSETKELLQTGVMYEEEFVTTYLKLLREEGFMPYFGDRQARAAEILDRLVRESTAHKATLENIMLNLK